MKINDDIEEYDVGSLQAIFQTVDEILKKISNLEQNALLMERNIGVAERDFTSENLLRAKEIIKKYIQTLGDAGVELKELALSVNDFAEKLKKAWREW